MRLYLNNKSITEQGLEHFFYEYKDKNTKYALQVGYGHFIPLYMIESREDGKRPFLSDLAIHGFYVLDRDDKEIFERNLLGKTNLNLVYPENESDYEILDLASDPIDKYQIFTCLVRIDNIKDPYEPVDSKVAYFEFKLRFEYNTISGVLCSYLTDLKPVFQYHNELTSEQKDEHLKKFVSDINNIKNLYKQLMAVLDSVEMSFKINVV